MLADLGADVIKVETPPDGDTFRRFGRPATRVSAVFANSNRGKRSIAPNLKTDADREALVRLVARADVWMSNWRPGVAARLGLGDEVLAAANPRLIRAYVTGYGSEGPGLSRPVFDAIMQASSGLTHALSQGVEPRVLPGYPVDKVTAMMVCQSVLAALYGRERTGRGERLDISMLASASYGNFLELFANRTFVDHQPEDPRNLHASSLRPVRTQDGWISLAPVTGAAIRQTCEAVGHREWVAELRSLADQKDVAQGLFDRLDRVLPGGTTDRWLDVFAARDVPAARCLTMDEHLEDEAVAAQGIYSLQRWEGFGTVRTVRYPAVFEGHGSLGAREAPPEVGQDDGDLLS
jgi:crotonobetainyl-CoA:carnitine CoA-transferase CaiB-like acyl-CoA transferase